MTKRVTRMSIFLPLLMGLFLLISPIAVRTASAHVHTSQRANANCYDTECDGLNPIDQGCNSDATSVNQVNFTSFGGGGHFEIRFSNACQAAWGRIVFNHAISSGNLGDAAIIRDTGTSMPDGDFTCDGNGGDGSVQPGQTFCYTPMLGDADGETTHVTGYWDAIVINNTASY